MNDFEDVELRRALRRVDAPEGFANRLRSRIDQRGGGSTRTRLGWAGALALAATLILAAGGAWHRAEEQRRAQGEEAKRQVLVGLNIASNKLRAIQAKVNHGEDR